MLYRDTADLLEASWLARGIDAEVVRRAVGAVTHRQRDPYLGEEEEERTRCYAPGFGNRAWLRVVVAYRSGRGNIVTGVAVGTLPPDAERT